MPVTEILIVDDFPFWQHFVATLLESETDFKIISAASDGLEAVQKAKELQPDVILMDVSLPGLSGIEATREIRKLCSGSKILFLSEHRCPDFIRAAFDAGGSGYVLKSDSGSDLIPGIRAILNGRQFVSNCLRDWRALFN